MITREQDYQTSMTMVQTPLSIQIMDLSDKMSSEEMNYNNATIYQAINTLYERIRVLEDIKDYIQTYTLKQIEDKKVEFQKTLSSIQKNQDIFTNDEKQAVIAEYSWSEDNVTDRNGDTISPLNYTETSVYPRGNTASSVSMSLIKHDCLHIPFTLQTNTSERYYEATYLLNKPEGIYDTVTFLFDQDKEINYISCDIYNANVQASYITESNEQVSVELNQYIQPITASGLVFDVSCKEYLATQQNIDIKKLNTDSFGSFDDTTTGLQNTESETAVELQKQQNKLAIHDYKVALS